jgi:hypothetical protein
VGSPIRYREVTSGGSFGNNSVMQHIGLGPSTVETIEITWPRRGAKPQVLRDVPVNACLEVTEGKPGFIVKRPATFRLGAGSKGSHQH